MTDYTPEALEALSKKAEQTEDDIRYYSGGSKYNEPLEQLKERLVHLYRTGQLIHAVPSGDEVEAVARKFSLGDRVTKTKGSSWTGLVVGFYSTSLTPIGYAVESENEPGSVQIYPESALASDPLLDRQGKEGEELPTAIDIAFAVGEEAHKRIGVTPLMREVMGLRKRTVHPPSCCCAYCASDWMGDD